MQCKMTRDFQTADRIRDELRGMGINVDDQSRTWSAGGGGAPHLPAASPAVFFCASSQSSRFFCGARRRRRMACRGLS
jgi:hypothetical protein